VKTVKKKCREANAGLMRMGVDSRVVRCSTLSFPLTPALSLGERESRSQPWLQSEALDNANAAKWCFPLLGEG